MMLLLFLMMMMLLLFLLMMLLLLFLLLLLLFPIFFGLLFLFAGHLHSSHLICALSLLSQLPLSPHPFAQVLQLLNLKVMRHYYKTITFIICETSDLSVMANNQMRNHILSFASIAK